MIKRVRLCAIVLLTFLSAACNRLGAPDRSAGSPLLVAMDLDLPGYFVLDGRLLGYPYELLEAYAASLGRPLHVISQNTPSGYLDALSAGRLDAVVVAGTAPADERQAFVPLYRTAYVVLSPRRAAPGAGTPVHRSLSGATVLISQGFTATASYDALLDSVARSEIVVSPGNPVELLGVLAGGGCDYVICERTEALLGCSLMRNLVRIHTFDESVPVGLLFDADGAAAHGFAAWLAGGEAREACAALRRDYFERGLPARLHDEGRRGRARGAVSLYDELFRRVGAEAGVDWRMLAAVSAVESRFNPYLISPRGARGLMQVMPAVAGSIGVDPDSLMDPGVNIRAGAQVMRRIGATMAPAPQASAVDRMSLTLAAYNGGVGTLADARRLAAKHGADPDSWSDVSRFLALLAEPDWAADEVVRGGTFRGANETLAFVDRVLDRYRAYGGGY